MQTATRITVIALALFLLPHVPAKADDDPVSQARSALERGDGLANQGQIEAACRLYEMAFVIAPEWWFPAYKKALCDMSRGHFKDAYYLLTRARASRANLYVIHLALGRWHRHEGHLEEAARAFEAAMNLAQGAVEPMLELADVLIAGDRHGEARFLLKRAEHFYPTNLAIRGRLALISEELGHLSDAESQLRYLALHGTNRRKNIALLARFYQRHKLPEKAQRVLMLLMLERDRDWTLPNAQELFDDEK